MNTSPSLKVLKAILLLIQLGLLAACSNARKISTNLPRQASAAIRAVKLDTTVNGTAFFKQCRNGKVKMKLEITVPSKASRIVAVHIHEHGVCGNMGKQAGAHWNPTKTNHGKWGSSSFHAGDLGNIKLDANGKGSMKRKTRLWTINDYTEQNIINRTIIVHSGIDDYISQPSGNSGERIGCGIISIELQREQ